MDGSFFVEVRNKLRAFGVAGNLLGCATQWIAKLFIQVQRNDGLGQVVQVSAENISSVVYCVAIPNKTLAVSIGGVENALELFYALLGTAEAENAFNASSWRGGLASRAAKQWKMVTRTFFFQKDATFGNNDGHIAVDIALALFID